MLFFIFNERKRKRKRFENYDFGEINFIEGDPFYYFYQKKKSMVNPYSLKFFYTLIDYLESLRLTASPISPIKLNPNAVVLEEFIPVLANSSDLASSGFVDS